MINGKVPEHVLEAESFTMYELMEAAGASPWENVNSSGYNSEVNLGFAVRWFAEWVVMNKREPEYETGEFYMDAKGVKFMRGTGDWPWAEIVPGVTSHWHEDYPTRPLRKLVPEEK
jgi:hypothetical protein